LQHFILTARNTWEEWTFSRFRGRREAVERAELRDTGSTLEARPTRFKSVAYVFLRASCFASSILACAVSLA
jgi:hypothetical protein